MSALPVISDVSQGSQEWLALRRTKITATDAPIILGVSHWKTKIQLYHEKLDDNHVTFVNERMQRGTDLESIARDLFCLKTGHRMVPKVVVKDWAMASLDGINDWNEILEIKCPGEKDHAIALSGKVPDHYYPQLQHQMWVCDSYKAYYFSFDGVDGVIVEVERDNSFIVEMIAEEREFYNCLQTKTPPEPDESNYVNKNEDYLWNSSASEWKQLQEEKKKLEEREANVRADLIRLSGGSNAKGSGISLCQVQRKGNIDYAKIPQLKDIDLEPYRKAPTTSWRITCQ